jgi:CheY-like chemotaxis protein
MLFFRRSPSWPSIPIEEIRKRARLLVIDDKAFPYQELFERDGYTLEKWSDVEDLSRLEAAAFDLVLLDLQGVGRQQSAEQGLGILRHIRQAVPTQIVIAYSGADWPLKYQDFFKLADAVLPKDSDYVDFKRKVDQLLTQRFSLGFYTSRLRSSLEGAVDDAASIEKVAERAIVTNSTRKLERLLEKRHVSPQTVSTVLQIVRTAISIYSLWKH